MEMETDPVKGDFERRAPHLGLQVLPWEREEGSPQAWLWQRDGKAHLILAELWISERAAGFPQSLLFPTLLQQKPVMRRHFLSQLETCAAHTTEVRDRRAG